MDELAKMIAQKTGLSEAQSRQAAQAAMDFLMTKLPAPLAEQVKSALSGGGVAGLADQAKGLGGLFGKK